MFNRTTMNYLQTLAYIESLSPTLERPSLKRIQLFMEEQGQPQDTFPSLHVAGTNGKGSTVAILDNVLRAAQLKVGRFTGPHLLRWNERFHLNGKPIEDEHFAELASLLREKSEDFGRRHEDLGPLTWFEFLTAIAFSFFAEEKVDIGVFEVGLGGRFDATNVLRNVLATAITSIALDHTHILGDTIEQIAFEKAGIIKKGVPVVTACDGAALAEIVRQANDRQASVRHVFMDEQAGPCIEPVGEIGIPSKELAAIVEAVLQSDLKSLSLGGPHQRANALVALSTLLSAGLSHSFIDAIKNGLANVYWPGRFQYLPNAKLILDGAHNPAGAVALRSALDEQFAEHKFCFVISCFENKDAEGMLGALLKPGDRVVFSEASTRRPTYPKERLAEIADKIGAGAAVTESLDKALSIARAKAGEAELTVATGSFASVRETMQCLGWQTVEDGISETNPKVRKIDICKQPSCG